MEAQVKRGEVYYADLSPTIGSEQGGMRPVIVIQNNKGNQCSGTVIVAAVSSRTSKVLPTHASLYSLPKPSIALMEQVRTLDKTRLQKYIGRLSDDEMESVNHALLVSLGMSA